MRQEQINKWVNGYSKYIKALIELVNEDKARLFNAYLERKQIEELEEAKIEVKQNKYYDTARQALKEFITSHNLIQFMEFDNTCKNELNYYHYILLQEKDIQETIKDHLKELNQN